jgi:DNA-binding beta-propeller fold protein YncE
MMIALFVYDLTNFCLFLVLISGDTLYVTDFNLHTVFQLDIMFENFRPLTQPGILHRPSGLTVDDAGNIIVCDNRNNCLKIFGPDGRHLHNVFSFGSSSPLRDPVDITLMKSGSLAILDNNGRVSVF